MAALYLHQALFAPEPAVPPLLASAPLSARSSYDPRLSSISTATLHTASHSDRSHPTSPLLHAQDVDSPAYLDLLARQPRHPSLPSSPAETALQLDGDPATPIERRSRWERRIRRKLRRLRWTKRILLTIIAGWATYNTVRYFLAFATYKYRKRQIITLALGSSTALSLTLLILSLVISVFAPRLGRIYRIDAPHVVLQTVLNYASSTLLLAPAIVNLVLTSLWRHSANSNYTLVGRCHWDIDVVWSGLGKRCASSPAWQYWVAGAAVRVALTAAFVAAYHLASYQYDVTRQPSRRRRHSRSQSGASQPFIASASASAGDLRPPVMSSVSSPLSPALMEHVGRQPSMSTSEGHMTAESFSSAAEHRPLRSSKARVASQNFLNSKAREVYQLPSAREEKEPGSAAVSSVEGDHDDATSSSEGCYSLPDEFDRYGQQVRRLPGAYSHSSPSTALDMQDDDHVPPATFPDHDLTAFADRFRNLVDVLSRETEEGMALTQHDRPRYYPAYLPSLDSTSSAQFPCDLDDDYVPVFGRTVHRMPTIESLGSRELMSLAGSSMHRASPGPHHISRPSTRSNNLSMSENGTSTPSTRSRANSLDAALALAYPPEDVQEDGAEQRRDGEEMRLNSRGSGSGSSASYRSGRSQ
ncbi:uncharacterized protein LAESUDRAFT_560262 [Laetiporus sulphureus 93-53]|uniref:Uncharacterized protein n=1 Tax=Laetiporus sulphureus 93-53 TaxID=1314785 RepID=A0A165B5F7_9APHY|nr:uncharacterized protein LAESUDRAFT_560262 [Laetiporus sulphureus 93-53]KZT00280.1 hypothetical protein LAESUDRAFT_560262 [Laetiporus sulphureus 93-53]